MEHDINNRNLPNDSRNIQLEIKSKNYFRLLFDPHRFVVKEETIDNGIDFRLELKANSKITGFGLNFQLKSTENTKQNIDGSYSKSIKTSNIEYLLNNGQPGFYGFYINQENAIYFVTLKEVIHYLTNSNPKWQEQANHTIKFKNKLDSNSIDEIYRIVFSDGISLRKTNALLAENFGAIKKNDVILTDFNYNVISESEIVSCIEEIGILLIDQCKWDTIISLHQKTRHLNDRSAIYNLVVGVSYYYSGEFLKSIDFLKQANRKINLLEPTLKEYLLFMYLNLQKTLNFITTTQYEDIANSFTKDGTIYLHQQLDEIKLLRSEMYTSGNISIKFEKAIHKLINNPRATNYIKNLAKIELLDYTSEQFISSLITILVQNQVEYAEQQFGEISKQYEELCHQTKQGNSNFAYHICTIKYCRFIIHFDCLVRRITNLKLPDTFLSNVLNNVNDILSYFKSIKHTENVLFTLTVLLEYYQNIENQEKILEVLNLLDTYIEQYDNYDFNKKINYTKEEGTFVEWIIKEKEKIDDSTNKILVMQKELKELEQEEEKSQHSFNSAYFTIHLFPMGNFQFNPKEIDLLFKILKINDINLIDHVKYMFKSSIIPVINCYPDEITEEGFANGNEEYKGDKNFINIYNIRKQLFEHKIHKVKI
ncbi:DUF4365 domain-containing protein [Myroides fluvii]|uniref:DUF4365 domain-containing protein n=1 Tax=Myroides fluvii TaxID=2572594 RepID=UPI00131DB90E|nr:DUF4365 domain-containing protein [Myroides fluvii]